MQNFLFPKHSTDGKETFLGHETVSAEGVAGLYVHRSSSDWDVDGLWRVSNVVGLRIYPLTIDTRREAREIARKLSPLMPPKVLSGEWDGGQWIKHDPAAVLRFKAAISDIAGKTLVFKN
jgi:hypothetical protein